MQPIEPFWFKQRQCKLESAGENLHKVSGPNLGEAFLHVVENGDGWKAGLRMTADGPEVASYEGPSAKMAWDAAFELYRTHVIA